MNEQPGKIARPASLDDLAALNREIAALVRAGLPLEESLGQIAEDLGKGRGEVAARFARDTAAGKSLAEAVAVQGDALPPMYRAVVDAGLRSGRLATALEGFAETAAHVADLRRIAAQAAVYPLIVFVLAWVMLLSVAALLVPSIEWLEIDDRLWISPLAMSRDAWLAWIVAVPVVAVALASVWWRRSASALGDARARFWTKWIPGARRTELLSSQASFAETLRLLLACRVPAVEAMPLAGSASGSADLRDAAARLASRLAAGEDFTRSRDSGRGLPPLVRTALLSELSEDGMLEALARAAVVYRERATAWTAHMAVVVPVAATLIVGAVVVGVYALLLFQPYAAALEEAAQWT